MYFHILAFEQLSPSFLKVNDDEVSEEDEREDLTKELPPGDVFISYCWTNSMRSYEAKQVGRLM